LPAGFRFASFEQLSRPRLPQPLQSLRRSGRTGRRQSRRSAGPCALSTRSTRRRQAAKELQGKGVPLDKIQTFLGHASLEQTEHYLRDREQAMFDTVHEARSDE
jgi:integrase